MRVPQSESDPSYRSPPQRATDSTSGLSLIRSGPGPALAPHTERQPRSASRAVPVGALPPPDDPPRAGPGVGSRGGGGGGSKVYDASKGAKRLARGRAMRWCWLEGG